MTADFKDHFSERAAAYASYRPHYPPALAEWLAGAAPRLETAWDAGCGSGQLSTLLGDYFRHVIATDASEAQIAQAARHPNLEYRVEPAEASSLPPRHADLITVAQAAHWLNLDAFYKEVGRVAAPGAVVALVTYARTRIDPATDAIIERFYGGVLDAWWLPERKHVENGYRDLPFPFPPIAAPAFEMQATWTVGQLVGYVRTWSAVRAMEAAGGAGATERFAIEIGEAWGAGAKSVQWPITIRAGRV